MRQSGAAPDQFTPHFDTVRRAQVGDHETRSGIGDDRVVATDVVVVEHDVVVGQPTYPGGRAVELVPMAESVAQRRDDRRRQRGPGVDAAAFAGALGGLLDDDRFLAQDPLVQGADRRPGIDPQPSASAVFNCR